LAALAQPVQQVPELTDSSVKQVALAKLAALVKPVQQVPKVNHSKAQLAEPAAQDQPARRVPKARQELMVPLVKPV
jgi:hypothetical protein